MTSLLPPSSSQLERDLEQATARVGQIPVSIDNLWNPDTCPVELLPWLAWAFAIEIWDASWSEARKREVIRNAIYIRRHQGTLGALKRAISSRGYTPKIVEWFEQDPPGEPGTFRFDVEITDEGISDQLYTEVEQIVLDAKNVRSWLSAIQLTGVVKGPAPAKSAAVSGEVTAIYPYQTTQAQQTRRLVIGSVEYSADVVTIYAQ